MNFVVVAFFHCHSVFPPISYGPCCWCCSCSSFLCVIATNFSGNVLFIYYSYECMHSFPIPILIYLRVQFFFFFIHSSHFRSHSWHYRIRFKKSFAINIPKLLCTKRKRPKEDHTNRKAAMELWYRIEKKKKKHAQNGGVANENQNARKCANKNEAPNVTDERVQASKVVQSGESEKPLLAILKRSAKCTSTFVDNTHTFHPYDDGENRICIIFAEMHIPPHKTPHECICNGITTYGIQWKQHNVCSPHNATKHKCDLTTLISSTYYMILCVWVSLSSALVTLVVCSCRLFFNSLLSYFLFVSFLFFFFSQYYSHTS